MKKKEDLQEKLKAFREKAQVKHCKYWKNPEDLGGKVSRSLVKLKKSHPSDGWIPGRYAADEKLFRTLEELRSQVNSYKLENSKISPPADSIGLAQGEEILIQPENLTNSENEKVEVYLEATWDRIFSYTGTEMIGECTDQEFYEKILLVYWHSVPKEYKKYNQYQDIYIYDVTFDQIKLQLQALGLITHGTKKRPISDKNTYWTLTPYGKHYLIKITAIKSENYVPKLDLG